MRTVTLKISASGMLLPAHPQAKPGPDQLMHVIRNVPADVSVQQCVAQANRICFAQRHLDEAAWSCDWSEIAGKPQGWIINRYPQLA